MEFTSFAQCFKFDVQVEGEPLIQDLLTHVFFNAFFDAIIAHRKDGKLPFYIRVLLRLCENNTSVDDYATTLRRIEVVGLLRMDRVYINGRFQALMNLDNRCATNSYLFLVLSYLAAKNWRLFATDKYLPILRAIGQRLYDSAEVIEYYSRIFGHYNLRVGQDI